ncbi:MAG: glycosyltransferase [Firmicutes bacterium]|nr:glycosyltransferase [Bacillota bacterium]
MNHFSLKTTYQDNGKTAPLVSIVVVCLNEESSISGCLNSLLSQEFPKNLYEIIAVDGGSEDKTREIVKQFPVALITDDFSSLGRRRNIGVRASKGMFIAFIDADCFADSMWLNRLVGVLPASAPEVAAVTGPNAVVEGDSGFARVVGYMQQTFLGCGGSPQCRQFKNLSHVISAPNCNALYRRDILLENPYDDGLTWGEDADLNCRLRKKGYKFLYCSQAVVWHYRVNSVAGLVKKMHAYGYAMAVISLKNKCLVRWYGCLPSVALITAIATPLILHCPSLGIFYLWCYAAYLFLVTITAFAVIKRLRSLKGLLTFILLPLQHISYGVVFYRDFYSILLAGNQARAAGPGLRLRQRRHCRPSGPGLRGRGRPLCGIRPGGPRNTRLYPHLCRLPARPD